MKPVLSGIASLAALLLFAGVMVGGFYLRSLHTPLVFSQATLVSPSPIVLPSIRPTAPDSPSPSPSTAAVPRIVPPQPPAPGPPQPGQVGPTCPRLVITSFSAQAGTRSVVLAWTVSGGCGDETGSIGGQFTGTMYPGYWTMAIHSAWRTITDHPQKPAGAGQQCTFSLMYDMILNGVAPDGGPPHAAFAQVSNVNLC